MSETPGEPDWVRALRESAQKLGESFAEVLIGIAVANVMSAIYQGQIEEARGALADMDSSILRKVNMTGMAIQSLTAEILEGREDVPESETPEL